VPSLALCFDLVLNFRFLAQPPALSFESADPGEPHSWSLPSMSSCDLFAAIVER
jgi:hypothetical protein